MGSPMNQALPGSLLEPLPRLRISSRFMKKFTSVDQVKPEGACTIIADNAASRPLFWVEPIFVNTEGKPLLIGNRRFSSRSVVFCLYTSTLPLILPLNTLKSKPIFEEVVVSQVR